MLWWMHDSKNPLSIGTTMMPLGWGWYPRLLVYIILLLLL